MMPSPIFQNLDCLGVQVPDIDETLTFYQKKLVRR